MASRAQSITVEYKAWDTAANGPKTGDVSNHTLRWIKDGTSAAPTNAASEVDSTNVPGVYKLTLTSTEATCDFGRLDGKSSTSGIVIIGVSIAFENLPVTANAPGAANGVMIAGSNAASTWASMTCTGSFLISGISIATAVWNALTSALTTAGSVGKWILDNAGASGGVVPTASQSVGSLQAYDGQGNGAPYAAFEFQMKTDNGTDAESYDGSLFTLSADGTGALSYPFVRLTTYRGRRNGGDWIEFDVPDESTFDIPAILGTYRG